MEEPKLNMIRNWKIKAESVLFAGGVLKRLESLYKIMITRVAPGINPVESVYET
jgi:hypothetical protein